MTGVTIAKCPNLLLKGSGRISRILGTEEDLTDALADSTCNAMRQGGNNARRCAVVQSEKGGSAQNNGLAGTRNLETASSRRLHACHIQPIPLSRHGKDDAERLPLSERKCFGARV
jgi:hypothetical protein